MKFVETYWVVEAYGVFLDNFEDNPSQFAKTKLYVDHLGSTDSPLRKCLFSNRKHAKSARKKFKKMSREKSCYFVRSVDIRKVDVKYSLTYKD